MYQHVILPEFFIFKHVLPIEKSAIMRLCLTIHRQSLPITRVMWTGEGLRLGQPTCGENFTISQLLEQVNEAIPLEAEEWGLEDYVVEVRGYECLHFSRIDQILRDEDEVT